MKTNSTGHVDDEQRTPWGPPAVKKIAIGAETKSAVQDQDNPTLTEPPPPSPLRGVAGLYPMSDSAALTLVVDTGRHRNGHLE